MAETYGLIFFPKPDAKMKYFLINLFLFTFASLMRRLIPKIIFDSMKISEKENEQKEEFEKMNFHINHSYFDLFSNFCADILSVIIILVNKCVRKIKSDPINTINGKKESKLMKKKSILYLSIIAFIDFIAQFCLIIFAFSIRTDKSYSDQSIPEKDLYFTVFFDIISRYIFSRIFLKSYFYNYHIFAIIITLVGFIPLTIYTTFWYLVGIRGTQIYYLILYFFMIIIYSLEDVFNKICLKQSLLRPYELMFYKAVLQIVLIVPLSIYVFITQDLKYYVWKSFKMFPIRCILYRASFIIFNILRTWSLLTVIEIIDANSLSILKSFEFAFLFFFIYLPFNFKSLETCIVIFGIIATVISIIGTAIHNELIIINKFGFLERTVYYKSNNFEEDKDLEKDINNNNKTADSLLGSSVEE